MKPTLLIVDDDEAIRTQMKWSLSEDYEVYFAQDRQEAVDAFEANSPAVTFFWARRKTQRHRGSWGGRL
jgi:CheY-like chemotaxis protein